MHLRSVIVPLALVVAFSASFLAQDAPPKEPFKAVHLINITSSADTAELLATLTDLNAAVAKAGLPERRYRLYKATGKQAGIFNYLLESAWPGGEACDKVHKSAEWMAAAMKHPEFERITKGEVYNRYVEVEPTKQ